MRAGKRMLPMLIGLGWIALAAWQAPVHAEESATAEGATDDGQRDLQLRLAQNSFNGPTGGIRVIDASSGPKGTFRLALNTEFFITEDYFVPGDRAQHFAGNLSLSVAAARFLEVFASAEVTSAWDNATDPRLVQRVADARFGVKGYHWISPWVALGADASVLFPGGVGDMRDTFRATSFGFRANATLDFRARPKRSLPIVTRFNAQYWFDNTGKLGSSIVSDAPLVPFQRFAYAINEVDTVRLGAGVELPLPAGNVGVHPLLEWRWDIPVNRQGFRCSTADLPVGDSCLSDEGVTAYPMTLTLGVRILTPPTGLAFTVAADVGLTGTSVFVRELAPNSPYNVILGVAYAIDARRTAASKSTSLAPGAEPRGRIYGIVVDSYDERPIEGAEVSVVGDEASAQVTDADGRFVSFSLPVTEVQLDVRHSDYQPGRCVATFEAHADSSAEALTEVACILEPSTLAGTLRLHVEGKKGRALSGLTLVARGAGEYRAVSDEEGNAALEVDAGEYVVYVEDPAYLVTLQEVDVAPREETEATLLAIRKPARPRVVVRERQIVLRSQVSFATGSNEILPNSEPLLVEVADALLRDPTLELVEIQGHTDNRGNADLNMKLSQSRAEAVKDWLVQHGVDASRLTAQGYGPSRPLVPNITAHNQARNRRVQFRIVRRGGASVAASP